MEILRQLRDEARLCAWTAVMMSPSPERQKVKFCEWKDSWQMAYEHDGHTVEASANKTHRGWKPELRIDGEVRRFAPTGRFQFKFFREEEEALIYADACAEWIINNRLN